MKGYTDRGSNGHYYLKEENFKGLKIKGFDFEEVTESEYKSMLMIYKFSFENKEERKRFEEFQRYIVNYQEHSKCGADFFQKDSVWYLRFKPMP